MVAVETSTNRLLCSEFRFAFLENGGSVRVRFRIGLGFGACGVVQFVREAKCPRREHRRRRQATTAVNGECRSKNGGGDDVDVIIVGAGVAGAALAHTLGKV